MRVEAGTSYLLYQDSGGRRDRTALGAEFPNGIGHDVQPEPSTAKDWVKNPGGAIRRKDRIGGSSTDSLKLVCVSGSLAALPTNSGMANANGLESQPAGSAGKLSRPATMKLLKFPWASFAQCRLSNEVAISGCCESKRILLAGAIGD